MKYFILLTSILFVLASNAAEVIEIDNEKISEVVAPIKEDVLPIAPEVKVEIPLKEDPRAVKTTATSEESLTIYFIVLTAILIGILALASIIPPPRSRKQ